MYTSVQRFISIVLGPGETFIPGIGNAGGYGFRKSQPASLAGWAKGSLVAVDAITVVVTGLLTKFVYLDLILETGQSSLPNLLVGVTLAAVLVIVFEQIGLYRNETITSPLVGFGEVWGGLAVAFLVTLGLLYALKVAEYHSRLWFLAWFIAAATAVVFARARCLIWLKTKLRSGQLRARVALVGVPTLIASMETHLLAACALSRVGGQYVFGNSNDSQGFDGDLSDLQAAMARLEYDQVIICIPLNQRQLLVETASRLSSYSAEVLLCTDMSELPVTVGGSRVVGNIRLDVVNVVPASERSKLVKFLLDYTLAAVLLLLLAPLFGLVALAIKMDSKGPVFFRQRRYGQNNNVFPIFKFRTMTTTEDGPVVRQAQKNDKRVTRVGWFLRRSSIDELPQLLNVLLGEMSIIGPRPHAVAHDDAFEREIDLFARRRRVRPGITGWAQVNGFRGETPTTDLVRQRMEYDLYYIDNWSIWFDIEIIARTAMVLSKKAY